MANPDTDSVGAKSNPDEVAKKSQPNSDLIPEIPAPVTHKPERTYSNPDPTPLWKIVLEVGAVAAGIIVAWIYYGQLNQMIESNRLTRQSLVASSRAWIAPANAYFTSDIAKNVALAWEVQYRNVGRSPALDTHAVWNLQQIPGSKFDDNSFNAFIEADDFSTSCKNLGTVIGADAAYPDQPDGYKLMFTNHLTTWVNDGIIQGDTAVVLQMCFAYRTMDEVHHTSFCYFYRAGVSPPNKQMNICTAGNHAD